MHWSLHHKLLNQSDRSYVGVAPIVYDQRVDVALDGTFVVKNALPLFILSTSLKINSSFNHQHFFLISFSNFILSLLHLHQTNCPFLLHLLLLSSLIFCHGNHHSIGIIRTYVSQTITPFTSPIGIMGWWRFVLWSYGLRSNLRWVASSFKGKLSALLAKKVGLGKGLWGSLSPTLDFYCCLTLWANT